MPSSLSPVRAPRAAALVAALLLLAGLVTTTGRPAAAATEAGTGTSPGVTAPSGTALGVTTTGVTAPSVTVSGTSLVDGAGRPLRLLGVNRSGTEYACAQGWGVFDGPTDDAAVAAIRTWQVNAVRVPLNEHCWLGVNGVSPSFGGAVYRDAVAAFVGRLHAAGLVVVLDLHWSAPGSTLATSQQVMADADHSPAFWTSVATRFRDDPGVVFDLYNEPHDISWACWRDGCTTPGGWRAAGMQALLDAVRATGARQPVIATGNQWGGDLSGWLAHRPVDPAGQLVAGLHQYSFSRCTTRECWEREIAPVAAAVPVVTGELGQDDCSGSFVTPFMQWADAHGIGYLGWTWNPWDCATGPALISAWDGTPTAFGQAVRDHLAGLAAAASPAPSPSPSTTSSPGPTPSASPSTGPSPTSSAPAGASPPPISSASPSASPSPSPTVRTTKRKKTVRSFGGAGTLG